MKKLFAILAWIVFAALAVNVAEARQNIATNQISGIVTRVSDGDTIWITNTAGRHKIRLVKIDAPESNQPYGKESAAHLKSLIFGKEVSVEYETTDRYGRIEILHARQGSLFIVRPHAQNLDNTLFLQYLIYEAVLDIDSTRYRPLQISNKRFIRRRSLKRIIGKYAKQSFNV